MSRVLLALVLVAVASGVALLLQRRRPDAPTQRQWSVPVQLDRADFPRPEADWLVAVFTSATCGTCAGVVERAVPLRSEQVAVEELEVGAAAALHERYRIDAVPTLVVADRHGVVRASFVGSVTATDLWATLAELREPGTLPEGGCQGGQAGPHDH